MKKLLTLSIIAIFSFSFIAKKGFTPPGTVKINDTLYVDKAEITNFNWQEFETWTKQKYGSNSKEHLAMLPDTNVWLQPGSFNTPYTKYYYRHIAYRKFPVVGVSYEQAVAFCKWRTDLVSTKNQKTDIRYTLPSKEEWEMYNLPFREYENPKGVSTSILNMNCKMDIVFYSRVAMLKDVTVPVETFSPNTLGIYNVFGNVAEMLINKGICKGGSWYHTKEECMQPHKGNKNGMLYWYSSKDIPYTNSNAWLGFRCVCVVKSK